MLFTNFLSAFFLLFTLAMQPRVISLAPSLTEIVKAYDVTPIAVSDYCLIENKQVPRLGGLTNPNIEAIVKLKPDHVLLLGEQTVLSQKLNVFNIESKSFYNGTVADIKSSIIEIGKLLNKTEKSEQILKKIELENHKLEKVKRVALIVAGDYSNNSSLIAAGEQSIYGELLKNINAKNIFHEAYPSTSYESLLLAKAEKIIFFKNPGQDIDQAKLENSYKGIEIKILNDSSLLVPGLNISEISKQMYEALK